MTAVSRIYYEQELAALRGFYSARLRSAPASEAVRLLSGVRALDAATRLRSWRKPQIALWLAARHPGPFAAAVFSRLVVARDAGAGDSSPRNSMNPDPHWFRAFPNGEPGTVHLVISDAIGCYGQPSGDLAAELRRLKPDKIDLTIDTTGGSCISALNTHAILSEYFAEVLLARNCWSAGIIIALAGKRIRAYSDSRLLVHSPTTHIIGGPSELRAEADHLEELTADIAQIIQRRTRQSAATVAGWLSGDHWFTAAEALAVGLVDEVIERPEPRPGSALARLKEARDAKSEAERFLMDLLAATGPIQTSDRAALARDVGAWFAANVREAHPEFCGTSETFPASSPQESR